MRYKTHDGDQPSKLETRMGTGAPRARRRLAFRRWSYKESRKKENGVEGRRCKLGLFVANGEWKLVHETLRTGGGAHFSFILALSSFVILRMGPCSLASQDSRCKSREVEI